MNIIEPNQVTHTTGWGLDPNKILDLVGRENFNYYVRPSINSYTNWVLCLNTHNKLNLICVMHEILDSCNLETGFLAIRKTQSGTYTMSIPCKVVHYQNLENSLPVLFGSEILFCNVPF